MKYEILVCLGGFGFFGFATYPVSLELAVETTYPVAEATSSGGLLIFGYVIDYYCNYMCMLVAIIWYLGKSWGGEGVSVDVGSEQGGKKEGCVGVWKGMGVDREEGWIWM